MIGMPCSSFDASTVTIGFNKSFYSNQDCFPKINSFIIYFICITHGLSDAFNISRIVVFRRTRHGSWTQTTDSESSVDSTCIHNIPKLRGICLKNTWVNRRGKGKAAESASQEDLQTQRKNWKRGISALSVNRLSSRSNMTLALYLINLCHIF